MSEFGKGTVYCLGLFLAHSERNCHYDVLSEENAVSIWFNGSSDHLSQMLIPEEYDNDMRERLRNLSDKTWHWGHGFKHDGTKADKEWSIKEALDLLLQIDLYHGIKAEEAEWK